MKRIVVFCVVLAWSSAEAVAVPLLVPPVLLVVLVLAVLPVAPLLPVEEDDRAVEEPPELLDFFLVR